MRAEENRFAFSSALRAPVLAFRGVREAQEIGGKSRFVLDVVGQRRVCPPLPSSVRDRRR